MPFFHYSQNNSGGYLKFDQVAGITNHVIIEAADADHANERAESIGLYFDGCDSGIDCDCCGDRWNRFWGSADVSPMMFGIRVDDAEHSPRFDIVVHYLNGSKTWH